MEITDVSGVICAIAVVPSMPASSKLRRVFMMPSRVSELMCVSEIIGRSDIYEGAVGLYVRSHIATDLLLVDAMSLKPYFVAISLEDTEVFLLEYV
jgi:hypothetical protein